MRRTSTMIRIASALAIAGLLLAGLALTATAHETREVEDEFEFVVGYTTEPAYVGQMNGLDLRIFYLNGDGHSRDDDHNDADDQYASDAQPVEGAEETLRAAIQFGGESKELDLRAVWGQPGHYTADVVPTSTGAYSFQITGEIDGVDVTETFSAGPDTFSEIESTDELNFPSGRSSDDEGGADQATAIAIAGVVAGLLGLAVGGVALYKVTDSGKPNPAQQRREAKKQQQQKRQGDQDA
jgi:hypothetical protein